MEGKKAKDRISRFLWHQRKRIMAFILAFTMTFINVVNNVSIALAAVNLGGDQQILSSDAVIFELDAEEVRELARTAADKASDSNASAMYQFLGESDTAEQYRSLFSGSIREITPSYDTNNDDVELKVFVKGNDKVVFLFINDTEELYECTVNLSGYMTDPAFVEPYANLIVQEKAPAAEAAPAPNGAGGSTGGGSGSGNAGPADSTEAPSTEAPSTEPTEGVTGEPADETDTEVDTENKSEVNGEDENVTDDEAVTPDDTEAAEGENGQENEAAGNEASNGSDQADDAEVGDSNEGQAEDSNGQDTTDDNTASDEGAADDNSASDEGGAADDNAASDEGGAADDNASADEGDAADDQASSDEGDTADDASSDEGDTADEGASSDEGGSSDTGAQASIISNDLPRVTSSVELLNDGEAENEEEGPSGDIVDADENDIVDGDINGGDIVDGDIIDEDILDEDADSDYTSLGIIDCSVYDPVAVDGAGVAAVIVSLADLDQIEVVEETVYYQVTYEVDNYGAAVINGVSNIEAGKNLTFFVKPQVGYTVDSVSVNGEEVEAEEDYRYVVEAVSEDIEVEVVTTETSSHPAFNPDPITIGDVTITVSAKAGVIPEGTEFVAEAVTAEKQAEIEEKVVEEAEKNEEEILEVLSYEIDLLYNGEKLVWEEGSVLVTFSGAKIEEKSSEADKIDIAHVDTDQNDEVELNTVATEEVAGAEAVEAVSFDAEHFSTYTITFSKENKGTFKLQVVQLNEAGETISEDPKTLTISKDDYDYLKNDKKDRYIKISTLANKLKLDEYEFIGATEYGWAGYKGNNIYLLRIKNGWTSYNTDSSSVNDNYTGDKGWTIMSDFATIYFWYRAKTTTVQLTHKSGTTSLVGNKTNYNGTDEIAVSELAGVKSTGYAFTRATLQNSNSSSSTEVKRIRKSGDKYQYSTENEGNYWYNFTGTPVLYFWYDQIATITFVPNGGTGESFSLQAIKRPGYYTFSTPQNPFEREGYTFVGWSQRQDGAGSAGDEECKRQVDNKSNFIPGVELKVDGSRTYYAIWVDNDGVKDNTAYFFVRTQAGEASIQIEPAAYDASDYYPQTSEKKADYSNANSHGKLRTLVAVNNNFANVKANLAQEPTPAQLDSFLPDSLYNPETDTVLWYVIKKQGEKWHVDGVVVPKNKYSVSYNANGGISTAASLPATKFYLPGKTVSVAFNPVPTREGYDFLGWDTNREATSPRYKVPNSRPNSFTMPEENVTLYAIWGLKTNLSVDVKYVEYNPNNNTSEYYATVEPLAERTIRNSFASRYTVEQMELTGYTRNGILNSNDPGSYTGTMKENMNTIYVTYLPRKDLSYTVHYVDADTQEPLKDDKIVNGQTFGTSVTENAVDIAGYDKVEPTRTTITIALQGNEITFFYKVKSNLHYTVHYLEQGSDNALQKEKLVPGKKFGETVTEKAAQIAGYNLVSDAEQSITIGDGTNVIIFYYSKRMDLSYVVKYVDDETNQPVAQEKVVGEKTLNQTVTEEAITVNGYKLKAGESTRKTIRIKASGNEIVFRYTKRHDLSYTVYYLEQGTNNKLLDPETVPGQTFGAEVTREAKTVIGYDLVSEPSQTIQIGTESNVITFYYEKKKNLSYTVHYYEEGTTTSLEEDKVMVNQEFGTTVTEKAVDIAGYNKMAPTERTITIQETGNEIIFYYTKRTDISYTVRYWDKDTDEAVAPEKGENGHTFGEKVTEEAIDVAGYNKVEPVSITRKLDAGENIITFYYSKKTDLSYEVRYLEKDTEKELKASVSVGGQTFKSLVTVNAADIDGYNKVEPVSQTIEIKASNNVVTFYYTKRNDLSYVVNYRDQANNELIIPAKTVDNRQFEEKITEYAENIEGYDKVPPLEAQLIISTDESKNVIDFYYTKRTNISYKVQYLDKDTKNEIAEEKIVTGQTFGDIVTENAIEIPGYNKEEPAEVTYQIKAKDNLIIFYYTKRTDLSYQVFYMEEGTTTELLPSKQVAPVTMESEHTESAEAIDGYHVVGSPSQTITIQASDNKIIFYYAKRTDLEYTVNYLEAVTNNVLHESLTMPGQTYQANVEESAISIQGYTVIGDPVQNITIGLEENVINFYYEKRSDLSYTVKYLEKGTNNKLADERTVGGQTYMNPVTEEAIDIDGYLKEEPVSSSIVIGTEDNVIIFYYTKRTDLSYTVNYLDEDTKDPLKDSLIVNNMTFGTPVTENAVDINGYNKVEPIEQGITIGTGENVINFYYTKRNDLSYTVRYLEEGTNAVLAAPKTEDNQVFEAVIQENAVDVTGYTLVSESPQTITIGTDSNEIVFYYTKRTDLSYRVQYVDFDTKQPIVEDKVEGNQTYNEVVTEDAIEIEGYNKMAPTEQKLTIDVSPEKNVLTFYYTKRKDISYVVNYLDKETELPVANQKGVNDQEFGSSVTENAIDVTGYDKVGDTTATITLGTDNSKNVINFYYTKRTDLSYTVHYLEQGSNDKLANDNTVGGQTFDAHLTVYAINIPGYNPVLPNYQEITITEGTNELTFYYTKRTDLTYKVKYLEKGTNNVLADEETVGDQTLGTSVTRTALDIPGYKKELPSSVTITIEADELKNIIVFYYSKRTDLSYTVQYLEKGTNNPLHEEKKVGNKTLGEGVTETATAIDGYNLIGESTQTLTIGANENVITFYYEKRSDLSYTVRYLDKESNLSLADDLIVPDMKFQQTVTVKALDIPGYDKPDPDSQTITISTGKNEIIFYYTKRTDLSYTVYYLEENSGNQLATPKAVGKQTFGSEVTETAIDIDGYNKLAPYEKKLTIAVAENKLVFYYTKRNDISYVVNYIDKDEDKSIAPQGGKSNQIFGAKITEQAIDITGYDKLDPTEETIILKSKDNVINFYYTKKKNLSYTVNYLEEGSNDILANAKTVPDQTYLKAVTENAIPIDGYDKVEPSEKTIIINDGKNEINFYYTKRTDLSYTVKYLDKEKNTPLAESKVENHQVFGSSVTETAIEIAGYNRETPVTTTITIGTGENVITFYYSKRNDLSYTVRYLEDKTNVELAKPVTVNNQIFESRVTETAIGINGYTVKGSDVKTITIGVNENIIVFYYTKRNDLSYTVNYLEDGTEEALTEAKTVGGQTYQEEITEKAVPIDGYYVKGSAEQSITIDTGSNVINFYYTKRTDLSYTVDYLEEGSVKSLADTKKVGDKTFGESVTEKAIDISGYNKMAPDSRTITIETSGNSIVFYYTKRNNISYVVNYLEKGTGEPVAEAKGVNNQTFEAEITEEAIDVKGYNKLEPAEHTIKLAADNNVINFYYEKRTDLSYTVKYLEAGTNTPVADEKTTGGQTYLAEVSENAIDVEGYDKVEPSSAKITIGTEGNEIIFYYTKRSDLSYTVRYLEKDTDKKVAEPKIVGNQVYQAGVTESAIAVEGYNKVAPTSASITIGVGKNEIIFYYEKRKDLSYTVHYLEKGSNEKLAASKTEDGQTFGAEVEAEAVSIDGYQLESSASQTIKIGTGKNEIVFYYSKRTDLSYTVRYLDQENKAELKDSKTVGNRTFQEKVTEDAASITGYDLVSAESQSIILGTGSNEIIFYYAKKKNLSYTVQYLEKGTNHTLAPNKTVGGQVFEAEVTESAIDITGYYKEEPVSSKLVIGERDNIIRFYYTKRQDISYTVEYLEKETGNSLLAKKTVEGKGFQEEITEEAADISGYNKMAPYSKTIKLEADGNQIIFYYTKRTDINYVVNYLDRETKKPVAGQKGVNGQTFGAEITETAVEVEGYNREEPISQTIKLDTAGNVINFYYTKRADLSYTVNYLEEGTNTVLAGQKTVGDRTYQSKVTEEAIPIDGYEAVEPRTQTITINIGSNEINFYYTKRTDLTYTVNYLEEGSNAALSDAKVVDGQTFEAEVTEKAIDIDGYEKLAPVSQTITIAAEGNAITFYYRKLNNLSYVVRYLERGTDKVLAEEKTVPDQTFKAEATEDAIEIVGYIPETPETKTITIGTGENLITFYYTKRSYQVSYEYTGIVPAEAPAVPGVETVLYEDLVTLKPIPEVPGYTFNGWILPEEIEVTAEGNEFKMPADHVIIRGSFDEKEPVEIRYQVAADSVGMGSVSSESELVAPATGSPSGSVANAADGYKFVKWTDAEGNTVSTNKEWIPQKTNGVFTEATYYAYFAERGDLSYEVHYYYDGTEAADERVTENAATLNEVIPYASVSPKAYQNKNYVLDRVEGAGKKVTAVAADNVVNVYYDLDEIGENDPKKPDGIADKYQITFTYTSGANGSVSGEVIEVVTRDKNSDGTFSTTNPAHPKGNVTVTGNNRYNVGNWTSGSATYSNLDEIRAAGFTEDTEFTVNWIYSGGGTTGGGSTGGGGGSSSGTKPGRGNGGDSGNGPGTTTINPADVPLASLPNDITTGENILIDDGEIPLAALPKTGNPVGMHAIMAMLSGMLLAAYLTMSKKKDEES